VRRIPGAEIVITSTWREIVGVTSLRKLFTNDVAERIVGATPIRGGRPLPRDPRVPEGERRAGAEVRRRRR
jgi:hypothetical protein